MDTAFWLRIVKNTIEASLQTESTMEWGDSLVNAMNFKANMPTATEKRVS